MSETTIPNTGWLTDLATDPDRKNSTGVLFFQGTGCLRFNEVLVKGGISSGSISSSHAGQLSSNMQTMQIHPVEVRIPRVQKINRQVADRYILLKKYEGFVCSRSEWNFKARLFENASDYPVIEAEFDLEELSETDRKLAVEGASLVWTIGYHENGSRRRESFIYLRRRPAWSENEVKEANQIAEELTRGIEWK